MKSWLSQLWSDRRFATWLALATLLLGVLGGKRAVGADVPALRPGAAEAPRHQCKCGSSCQGRSCCCVGKPTLAKPLAERPTGKLAKTTPAAASAAPCWKATPCDESGQSSSSTVGPIGRAALLGRAEPFLAAMSRRLNLESARTVLPPRRADRLDDPPESPIGA